jgi:hypothetical protein
VCGHTCQHILELLLCSLKLEGHIAERVQHLSVCSHYQHNPSTGHIGQHSEEEPRSMLYFCGVDDWPPRTHCSDDAVRYPTVLAVPAKAASNLHAELLVR